VTEVFLGAAIEIGSDAFHHEKVFGLKLNDTRSDETRAFSAGLHAALPQLLRDLAHKAEQDWIESDNPQCKDEEPTIDHVTHDCPAFEAMMACEWLTKLAKELEDA
jgi:hypothetical protein